MIKNGDVLRTIGVVVDKKIILYHSIYAKQGDPVLRYFITNVLLFKTQQNM